MTEISPNLFAWAGYLGVAFYLGSYAALQAGLIRGSGKAYSLLNLTAASLVLISLADAFNLASAIIQISWIALSIVGLFRLLVLSRFLIFSAEERGFLMRVFPDMQPFAARRFLGAGAWVDMDDGDVLTEQGTPVDTLYYVMSGHVGVYSDNSHLGTVTDGFLGELNVLNQGPATATTRAQGKVRAFKISGKALARLCQRDGEFRMLLENRLFRDTRQKLMSANDRIIAGAG